MNAICHSHAPAIIAVCCLEGGLQIFDQRGGAFVPLTAKVASHPWQGISDS